MQASPLPAGRHHLTRDVVLASQRGRLLEAAAEAIAERGYAATTIADVVARAAVSKKTFYEHFDGKQECFLAAFDAGMELLAARTAEALEDVEGWHERLAAGLRATLGLLAEEPDFTRMCTIEALAAGQAGAQRYRGLLEIYAQRFRVTNDLAHAADPRVPRLPDDALRAVAAGFVGLIAMHAAEGTIERLPSLETVLLEFLARNLGAPVAATASAPAA